ncbi:hypothetical protein [Streptomyces nigrescens]|uniref:hypothetical protein n=1 Tax=Streptomyces nigrescens TaxID=1920 RepID=UPI00367C76F9
MGAEGQACPQPAQTRPDTPEILLSLLTPDDKLWLLDGDEGFWPGLAEMSAGYKLNPIVMGANSRHTTL